MNTKTFEGQYKGTIAVWEIDDNGEKVGKFPIVSLGKKKLQAILNHLDEVKEFIKDV